MLLAMELMELLNIDEECQLSQWCQSGMEVVGYVQRPWGIHINRGESRIERGVVRKQMDVPLQWCWDRGGSG
jgi:hypothetical protein